MSGSLHMNGKPYSQTQLKVMAGYVMQDDLCVATMSVQETLDFTAKLRLPADFTAEQRRERVEEVMKAMGISETRDTAIGNELRKVSDPPSSAPRTTDRSAPASVDAAASCLLRAAGFTRPRP